MNRVQKLARMCGVIAMTSTAVAAVVSPVGAQEESSPGAEHCVTFVIGQEESGEYDLTTPTCFSETEDAMSYVGLGEGLNTLAEVESAVSIQSTIAIHYDGAGFTGSSLSVSGTTCGGGYANMSATWNDRVSSTLSGTCGRIRHFTGANKTGTYQDTLPNGNLLSPVNNAASSIQYLP